MSLFLPRHLHIYTSLRNTFLLVKIQVKGISSRHLLHFSWWWVQRRLSAAPFSVRVGWGNSARHLVFPVWLVHEPQAGLPNQTQWIHCPPAVHWVSVLGVLRPGKASAEVEEGWTRLLGLCLQPPSPVLFGNGEVLEILKLWGEPSSLWLN